MMPRKPLRRLTMVLPLCGAVLTPMTAVSADSATDHFGKAHSYYEKWLRPPIGKKSDPALLDAALAELAKAHKGLPKEPVITQWIGFIKLKQEKFAEALPFLQETIRLDPNLPEPYINSGFANAKLEHYAEAAAAYQRAIPVIKMYAVKHTENNQLRFQLRKVYLDLGQVYFKQNRLPDALEAYNHAADLDTDRPKELTPQETALYDDADRKLRGQDEAQIQDSLGETLAALDKPEDAARAYERAAALAPTNLEYRQQQGRAYRAAARKAASDPEQAKTDWKRAGQAFLKAAELKPDDYANREYYAEALEEQGLEADALTQYAQAAKDRAAAQGAAPTPADALYHDGLALARLERWSDAETQFALAARADPNKAEIFQWLGYARYQQKEYDAAIDAYRKAAALSPERAETYLALGSVYEAQKDNPAAAEALPNALDAYKKAAELDPKSARAQYNLGSVYLLEEKYGAAAESFHNALALDPNGMNFDAAQANAGLGYALRKEEPARLTEAEAAQEAAVKLQPTLTKSWIEIALIYTAQATAEDARLTAQHLPRAEYTAQRRSVWNETAGKLAVLSQRAPETREIHDLYGSALARANRGADAITQFNQGVSLDDKPYQFLSELGEALETQSLFDKSEDVYKKALAAYAKTRGSENTLLLNHLGRTQIMQKTPEKYADAEATFAKVILQTPHDMRAYMYRSEALRNLNRTDEAMAALEAGLKVKGSASADSEQKQAVADMERSLAYELTLKGGASNLHQAAELYNAALPAARQSTETFIGLGEIEIQRKNYKGALRYLKQAAAIDPKNDAAYGNLNLTAAERAQYINRTRSIAYNNLGAAYEGLDNLSLAAESYRKAIALDPNNARAKANRERYDAFLKLKLRAAQTK